MAIEDFNGDGKPDLAITNHCFDSNSINLVPQCWRSKSGESVGQPILCGDGAPPRPGRGTLGYCMLVKIVEMHPTRQPGATLPTLLGLRFHRIGGMRWWAL
ncbi:MAG: FG-GAP repeat protein [Acidobacteriia bacterium]|nr:FG-GAP repeat protein [Terriglobia bacterium]